MSKGPALCFSLGLESQSSRKPPTCPDALPHPPSSAWVFSAENHLYFQAWHLPHVYKRVLTHPYITATSSVHSYQILLCHFLGTH